MIKREKGFTLTEILVSMTLIGFSSIFLMKCMIISLHQLKNSGIRFHVTSTMEARRNYLSGKKFDSPELMQGKRTLNFNGVLLEIRITDTSPGLKNIFLHGEMEGFSSSSVFTISQLLKEE